MKYWFDTFSSNPDIMYIGGKKYPLSPFYSFNALHVGHDEWAYKGYKLYLKFTFSTHILSHTTKNKERANIVDHTARGINRYRIFDASKYNDAVHILKPFLERKISLDYTIRQCKHNDIYVISIKNYYIYFRFILYDSYCIEIFITSAQKQDTPPPYKMHKGKPVEYVLGDALVSSLQKRDLKYHKEWESWIPE